MERAYFAGGCFWCTEAVFQSIRGVIDVMDGYAGGETESPSYDQVSSGDSGHAEAIQIIFDPKIIKYSELLYIFFNTHDPTTVNQQGADVGSQYRSVVFYENEGQKNEAEKAKAEIQKKYKNKVVTEIVKLSKFFIAEDYHQDYYNNNKNATYCRIVIDPKIKKLKKEFTKYVDVSKT